jgi:hypothetical protein
MESTSISDWVLDWSNVRIEDEIHVIPNNDLIEHEVSNKCWCIPLIEEGVVSHRSLDMREVYENHMQRMN